MSPGGEATTIEEYLVTPASEQISIQEGGRDFIKLYGPNQGVSMVAQPINGQGSMISRSILTLSRQGSLVAQAAANLKDPIVNLFGSMHEGSHPELGTGSRLIVDPDQSPFGTNDNLHASLLSRQGSSVVEKNRFYGIRNSSMSRSNSMRGSNTNLVNVGEMPKVGSNTNLVNAGEMAKVTNIGGGWQLAYKTVEGKEEGGLQRVYLHADPTVGSHHGSFVGTISGYDLHSEGGESFQAAALVSHSVLSVKDNTIKPEVVAKRTGWGSLLEPGVRRALIVGVGLQFLQQVHLVELALQ